MTVRTIECNNCDVMVWPTQERMVTIFKDGTEVPATPEYSEESHARSRSLGYRDDIWRMTLEHELLHTHLAESRGWPYSPALWQVAHPNDPWPEFAKGFSWEEEEAEVLRVQHAKNWMQHIIENCLEK